MIVIEISKGPLAGVQHKKQETESSRPGIFDIKTIRQVNYVRGVAYRVSGFFCGHASTLTATSHLDRHSCTITGGVELTTAAKHSATTAIEKVASRRTFFSISPVIAAGSNSPAARAGGSLGASVAL
jgi:hypothetical protein